VAAVQRGRVYCVFRGRPTAGACSAWAHCNISTAPLALERLEAPRNRYGRCQTVSDLVLSPAAALVAARAAGPAGGSVSLPPVVDARPGPSV